MAKMIDKGRDVLESLTHDQARRTGITCERIARSLDRGVAPAAIAAQLTENERKRNKVNPEIFTAQDVMSAAKVFRLNKSGQIYSRCAASELEYLAQEDEFLDQVFPS